MNRDVVEVKVEAPLSLHVRFHDGTKGEVHFEPSYLTAAFRVLKDQQVFEQVHIDGGAVAWPGELNLAPDAMYSAIKSEGEWILRKPPAAASGQRDATKAQAGRANFAKIELRQDKANAPVACIAL